jgi:hypothetical protein
MVEHQAGRLYRSSAARAVLLLLLLLLEGV